jgi:hypothetical protein
MVFIGDGSVSDCTGEISGLVSIVRVGGKLQAAHASNTKMIWRGF